MGLKVKALSIPLNEIGEGVGNWQRSIQFVAQDIMITYWIFDFVNS